jgi:hypothetical protein
MSDALIQHGKPTRGLNLQSGERRVRLIPDLELCHITHWLLVQNLNALHGGGRRSFLTPLDEFVNILTCSLGHDLDPTINEVFDPTVQTQGSCNLGGVGPEEDPLDNPGYIQVSARRLTRHIITFFFQ